MAPVIPDNDTSPRPDGASERSAVPTPDGQAHPAPQQPAPSAVGIALGQARQAKNKSLEQVAVRLRIKTTFLKALETGDTQALPGPVYALGFVRSYAEYLDLDPAQTVRDYKQEAADFAQMSELSFPVPTATRSTTGIPLMVVLGALTLAGLGSWFASQSNTVIVAEGIPTPPGLSNAELTIIAGNETDAAPPDRTPQHIATALLDIARPKPPASLTSSAPRLTPPRPLPAATVNEPIPWPAYVLPPDVVAALKQQSVAPKGPPPTPLSRPVQDIAAVVTKNKTNANSAAKAKPGIATAKEQPETAVSDTATVLAKNAPQKTTALADRPTPARNAAPKDRSAARTGASKNIPAIPAAIATSSQGRAYGQSNRDARIVIAAEADIWIQIRDRNQNDLFTRLLRAGDSYRVPNRPDLLLFTGNAGGLRLTVDGKPVAPLGSDGAVRRDVALNADSLLSGTTTQ